MTSTSPFVWLKDLCTHFDWLHAGSLALAEGQPLPPTDSVPDHAIGEMIRAFHRIEIALRAQREEAATLRADAETRQQAFHTAQTEAEGARRALDEARAALEHAQRMLDDRQKSWEEAEGKWLHERQSMEQRIGDLDQRVRSITGRLNEHAQVLHTVASDLTAVAR